MSNFVKISEAASIGFHTAAYLAQNPGRLVSSREVAQALHVSENHLSKVLQRLAHAGIVDSMRGPTGGFRVHAPWERVRLIDIYEAIEGPITPAHCLLDLPICRGNRCALGVLIHKTNEAARRTLAATTLAEMARTFRPCYEGLTPESKAR